MNKAKEVAYIIIGVIILYGILALFMVFVADQSVVTNATLAAAHNMAQYPGTSGFLLSTPWILYPVPAIFGIIWIVLILRKRGV